MLVHNLLVIPLRLFVYCDPSPFCLILTSDLFFTTSELSVSLRCTGLRQCWTVACSLFMQVHTQFLPNIRLASGCVTRRSAMLNVAVTHPGTSIHTQVLGVQPFIYLATGTSEIILEVILCLNCISIEFNPMGIGLAQDYGLYQYSILSINHIALIF